MNVLVDTSVWSLALRRRPQDLSQTEKAFVDELTGLINEGRARIIGVVRQELLSGIKSMAQYEKLRDTLRSFPDESINTPDYEAAARVGNVCRSRGIAVSVIDMLLCVVASSRGWALFTTDPDFKNYAKFVAIRLHVPRS